MAQLGVFIMPIVTVQSWLTDPMFGFISCGPMYVWNMVYIPYDGLYPMIIPMTYPSTLFSMFISQFRLIESYWTISTPSGSMKCIVYDFSCSTTSSNSKLRYTQTYIYYYIIIIMALGNPLLTTCASWFQAKVVQDTMLFEFSTWLW